MSEMQLNKKAKADRLRAVVEPGKLISTRAYNTIMSLTIAYGLFINVLLCAFVGNVYNYVNPLLFLIAYFVLCIGGITIANRSSSPAVSFLGYNMVVIPMGLVISSVVSVYVSISPAVVLLAFIDTLIVTGLMVVAAVALPSFFAKMGRILGIAIFGLIICYFVNALFFRTESMLLAWVAAAIFSLYIGYDFWRSQQYPKTVDNAIDCALDIYVDIANLFLRILEIVGSRSRK